MLHTCQDPSPNKGILTSFVRSTDSTLALISKTRPELKQLTPNFLGEMRVALINTRNITDLEALWLL